jgi:hypothetical protein
VKEEKASIGADPRLVVREEDKTRDLRRLWMVYRIGGGNSGGGDIDGKICVRGPGGWVREGAPAVETNPRSSIWRGGGGLPRF